MSFSIQMALSQVISSSRKSMEEKGIDLYKEVDLAIPLSVEGKQLLLTHIVHTLINEAARHLTRGKIVLKANLLQTKKENIVVDFLISYAGANLTATHQDASLDNYKTAVIEKMRQLVKNQGGVLTETSLSGGRQYQFSLPYQTEQILDAKLPGRHLSLNNVFSSLTKKISFPVKNAIN